MKICGVYRNTNTITGDFYIGSSKDAKRRWKDHKCPSNLKKQPNNQLYQDMKKYGIDKFVFEILEEVEESSLKEIEQKFIEKLQPTYNQMNANGRNVERYKETNRKFGNKYRHQLCCYNGQYLTLNTLSTRFRRQGIDHPVLEAKKYLLNK